MLVQVVGATRNWKDAWSIAGELGSTSSDGGKQEALRTGTSEGKRKVEE